MRFAAFFVVAVAVSGAVSCKESVEVDANAANKTDTDLSKPLEPSAFAARMSDEGTKDSPLFGERQDLTLKGPATTLCKCLAVAVGQPSDAAFQWSGERPRTNRDSQLVVALTSTGVACPDAGDKAPGASYWGYESVGSDVVIVVENAAPGRPIASGAIIPRPLGGGQVFVRPADKKIVYGRPSSGKGDRCQVGNLPPVAAKADTPATVPSSGIRIRTDEADPTSTREDMP